MWTDDFDYGFLCGKMISCNIFILTCNYMLSFPYRDVAGFRFWNSKVAEMEIVRRLMKMFAEGKQKIHSWWWQGPGWCWGGKWHLSSWVPDWTEWNYSKVHVADNLVDIPLGQVNPCGPPGLLAHQLNFPLGCSDHTGRWNNCLHRLFFHRRGKLPREGIWRLNIPGTPGSRRGWNWSMAGTDVSVKLTIRMQVGEVLVICRDNEWVSSPLRQMSPLLQS